jgi:hypothetical protein
MKIRRDVLEIDLAAIPQHMVLNDILDIATTKGVILIDSKLKPNYRVRRHVIYRDVIAVDINSEEGKKIYNDFKVKQIDENTGR